jgi:hypothetical protein
LNANRKVLFIVHGYLEHGNKKWIKVWAFIFPVRLLSSFHFSYSFYLIINQRMVQQALDYDDINVIVVDWVGGI